jgi:hypothetical protein
MKPKVDGTYKYGANTVTVLAVKGSKVKIEVTSGPSMYPGTTVWVPNKELTKF